MHVRVAWHVTRRLTLPYPRSAHAHGAHQCFERHRTSLLRACPVAPVLRLPCSEGGQHLSRCAQPRAPAARRTHQPGANARLRVRLGVRAAACTARRPCRMAAGCCFLYCTLRFATGGALFTRVVPRDGYTLAQFGSAAMLACVPRLAAICCFFPARLACDESFCRVAGHYWRRIHYLRGKACMARMCLSSPSTRTLNRLRIDRSSTDRSIDMASCFCQPMQLH